MVGTARPVIDPRLQIAYNCHDRVQTAYKTNWTIAPITPRRIIYSSWSHVRPQAWSNGRATIAATPRKPSSSDMNWPIAAADQLRNICCRYSTIMLKKSCAFMSIKPKITETMASSRVWKSDHNVRHGNAWHQSSCNLRELTGSESIDIKITFDTSQCVRKHSTTQCSPAHQKSGASETRQSQKRLLEPKTIQQPTA